MAQLLKKLKAGTLVETLVAITLISLTTGFAMVIFLMVSSPGSSIGPLMQAQQRSAEMLDTINPLHLGDPSRRFFEVNTTNLTYIKTVSEKSNDLYEVHIEVKDNNDKVIYTRKRLMYGK